MKTPFHADHSNFIFDVEIDYRTYKYNIYSFVNTKNSKLFTIKVQTASGLFERSRFPLLSVRRLKPACAKKKPSIRDHSKARRVMCSQ